MTHKEPLKLQGGESQYHLSWGNPERATLGGESRTHHTEGRGGAGVSEGSGFWHLLAQILICAGG